MACGLRARGALRGSLHGPGGQVDGDEGAAGGPQPVPPEPAPRRHSSAGHTHYKTFRDLLPL